jgi:hypothetical protein
VGIGEIGIGETPEPIREPAFPVIDIGNLLQSFWERKHVALLKKTETLISMTGKWLVAQKWLESTELAVGPPTLTVSMQ